MFPVSYIPSTVFHGPYVPSVLHSHHSFPRALLSQCLTFPAQFPKGPTFPTSYIPSTISKVPYVPTSYIPSTQFSKCSMFPRSCTFINPRGKFTLKLNVYLLAPICLVIPHCLISSTAWFDFNAFFFFLRRLRLHRNSSFSPGQTSVMVQAPSQKPRPQDT